MAKVVDIGEFIPHCVIIGPMNEPHVVPVCVIQRMATGSIPLVQDGQEEIDQDMIRGIIQEWLDMNGY